MSVSAATMSAPGGLEDLATRVFRHVRSGVNGPAFTLGAPTGGASLTLTLAQLHQESCRIAGALLALGLGQKRLALAATSGLDAVTLYMACQYAGIAPAMVPTPENLDEVDTYTHVVEPLLAAFQPACLLLGDPCAQLMVDSMPGAQWRAHVSCISLDELRKLGHADLATSGPVVMPLSAPAHYLFTSGTTGRSKIVAISRRAVVLNTRYVADRWDFRPGDCLPSIGAPFHSGALMVGIIMPLYVGARGIIVPPVVLQARPEALLSAAAEARCTHIVAGDGVFARALMQTSAPSETIRYPTLRRVIIGGEPLSPQTLRRITQHFQRHANPGTEVHTAYGMTEAAGLIATSSGAKPVELTIQTDGLAVGRQITFAREMAPFSLCLVSCGQPSHGVEIRVVDGAGRALGEEMLGCIEYRSPSQFDGYLTPAEDSLSGGAERDFFPTGDLGFLRGGEVFVLGRVKEMLQTADECRPADFMERLVLGADSVLQGSHCVVVQGPEQVGRLLVLLEVPEGLSGEALARLSRNVAAILAAHTPFEGGRIELFARSTLPRLPTTAKKIRLRTRDSILAGTLQPLHSVDFQQWPAGDRPAP